MAKKKNTIPPRKVIPGIKYLKRITKITLQLIGDDEVPSIEKANMLVQVSMFTKVAMDLLKTKCSEEEYAVVHDMNTRLSLMELGLLEAKMTPEGISMTPNMNEIKMFIETLQSILDKPQDAQ